ncbi:MAG TPA: cytochrome C biogenesis protein [Bacteroidales bacterium]|nr:cytochrome C biogenesis protein [Bacteroidales bacterium]
MELLQNLADGAQAPLLYAFILGLMSSISPCTLATNITAIAYISKELTNKRKIFLNGIIYTLGRAISYTSLGLILYFGASKFEVAKLFQANGEKILGPLLIIIGIFMLDIFTINFPSFNKLTEKMQIKSKNGSSLSALLLGMLFALAFCPYGGVLFFGMLIPLTIASASGLYLPIAFAFATGLPVIIIAYLLAFSVSSIGGFYNKIQVFQKWFNRVVAAIFILVGLYYVYIFYIQKLLLN